MELKLSVHGVYTGIFARSNRTFMELKSSKNEQGAGGG